MKRYKGSLQPRALAVVVALGLAPAAHAVNFEFDNGATVIWNTTISAGTSVRASDPDPKLIHPNNAALYGITGALGGNTDDGTLNFEKGKQFSTPFKNRQGKTATSLMGETIESDIPSADIGQTQRPVAVTLDDKEVARIAVDFSRLE